MKAKDLRSSFGVGGRKSGGTDIATHGEEGEGNALTISEFQMSVKVGQPLLPTSHYRLNNSSVY